MLLVGIHGSPSAVVVHVSTVSLTESIALEKCHPYVEVVAEVKDHEPLSYAVPGKTVISISK